MSPVAQRKLCIFCGKPGTTKEHVFPAWLRGVVPTEGKNHSYFQTHTVPGRVGSDPAIVTVPKVIVRSGHSYSRTVKRVCRPCNTGWMSRLQEQAKLVLVPLILGGGSVLSFDEQNLLATWITMTAMVAEYTDVDHIGISAAQRRDFYRDPSYQPDWTIWIGRYAGDQWNYRYRHNGVRFGLRPPASPGSDGLAQWSTFVIGSLLIHCFSSTNLTLLQTGILPSPGLFQIPYRTGDAIDYSTLLTLSDEDADFLSGEALHIFARSNEL